MAKLALIRPHPSVQDIQFYNSQEIGLANALAELGHYVDVICIGPNNKFEKQNIAEFENGSVSRILLPYKKLPIIDLIYFPKLSSFLHEQQYEFVHVNEFNEFVTYQVSRFSKKHKVPFVYYQGMYKQFPGKIYSLYQIIYDFFCLPSVKRHTSIALAKTSFAEKYIQEKGFTNTKVIPVGLDTKKLVLPDTHEQDFAARFAIPTEHTLVIYIGSFEPRRNIELLTNIAQTLKDEPITFLYIGEGELLEGAKQFKQTHQLENLLLPGAIPQSELAAIYERAQIVLLASDYEIYGMILLEAMYFATAAISTLNAGSVDLINDDNGCIIESKDLQTWCDKVKELSSSTETIGNMSKYAQVFVQDNLTWEKVAEKYQAEILDPNLSEK
ncbi:glycosyltransferase family 4 protein [Glaciecola petra]|uniref:Glycosyltransferase family 4 protein n=1 Tax=Glaciecola petra TaxID=3075602 RepID=A0ABU2ZLV4_9ALTE|nr:glycosyltransferase family 4 protein [Aestuariibacter sp. P117]MDT0593608.1 glycosyltransferase family 4 protein [Aestuariibacter sp. P117]